MFEHLGSISLRHRRQIESEGDTRPLPAAASARCIVMALQQQRRAGSVVSVGGGGGVTVLIEVCVDASVVAAHALLQRQRRTQGSPAGEQRS